MEILLPIAILIISVVVHEVSHGYAALLLGDYTAKYQGRLSLNPLKHLDPWGSVLIPFLLIISGTGVVFGWAKPVPYNPYNLRDQKYGSAKVGLAGPLSNIILALLAGIGLRAFYVAGIFDGLLVNILLLTIIINISLVVFNLLPIPPLDGSKALYAFISISEQTKMLLDQYGMIILFAFLWMDSKIFGEIFNLSGGLISFLRDFVFGIFMKYVVGG